MEKLKDIEKFIIELKKLNIKNVKLPVSAPFHCPLMSPATKIMNKELMKLNFLLPNNMIVSNVTAEPSNDPEKIKKLLIDQIEKPVRWRESIINMINLDVKNLLKLALEKYYQDL